MKRVWLLLPLLAILVVSGCVGQYGKPTTPTPIEEVQPTTPTEQVQSTGEVKEFIVEGSEFKFSPAAITVSKGDSVKVTFKNVGSTGHNFVVGDLGVSTSVISPGTTETVDFIASRSGTFAFYCSVPGHRAAGMEGQVVIS